MIDAKGMIEGSKVCKILVQPTDEIFGVDTFVINFIQKKTLISLHSFSFVRAIKNNVIVYTSTDHYLNSNGYSWKKGQKKLSTESFKTLIKDIENEYVDRISISKCKDIHIFFRNGVILEFIVDTSRSPDFLCNEIHRIMFYDISNSKNNNESFYDYVIYR